MIASRASACARMSALSVPRRAGRAVSARAEPEDAKAPEPTTPTDAPKSDPKAVEPVIVVEAEPVDESKPEATTTDEVSSVSAHHVL